MKLRKEKGKNKRVKMNAKNCLCTYLDFSSFRLTEQDLATVGGGRTNLAANYVFRLKHNNIGKYMSVVAIYGIDIMHYSNDDKISAFNAFGSATQFLDLPHKYIFSHKKPDLSRQREFLEYKKSQTHHPFTRAMLDKKLRQIDDLERTHRSNLAYMFVYADDIDTLYAAVEQYCNAFSDTSMALCNFDTTIRFMRTLLNFSDCENRDIDYQNINAYVLPDTVKFGQNYFKVNNTYVTSVVIKSFPALLAPLALTRLVSQKYSDIVSMWDVCTAARDDVQEQLKQSMDELNSRWAIRLGMADNIDTQTELAKIQEIYNSVVNGAENMVYMTLRFYIFNKDLSALKKRVAVVQKELDTNNGLRSYVPENQMFTEFTRLIVEGNNIQTPMPIYDTYAKEFPFYYQEHIDDNGLFMGYTQTNGLVFLDSFLRNRYRSSYDMILCGVKGGGKSVTLKSMVQNQLIIGNKVFAIDIEGEYKDLAMMYDGQVITMDRRAFINPLQIRTVIDWQSENKLDEEENDDDTQQQLLSKESAIETNFISEISRICTFMYQYVPTMTYDVMTAFRTVLVETYQKKGITKYTDVNALAPQNFPTFSDVLDVITSKISSGTLSADEITLYKTLLMYVKELSVSGAYGTMFDSHTNIEINNSNLIVFNVKALSEMDENVYNAQLFNILSLMWSEVCKNVAHNNNLVNLLDRRRVICLIDEAHRFINTKNTLCTDFILKLERRSRKYDAGLWYATQSILDFMPSDTGESVDTVKKIFQLVQYKFLLKQSSDSIEILHNIFGQFTISELYATDNFEAGEILLSLGSGKNKIHCKNVATECDLMYIGNSQDRDEIVDSIFNRMYLLNWSPQNLADEMYRSEQKTQEFIETFTREVIEYFGFKITDSEYLYVTVNRLVKNLAKRFGDKYNVRKW